MQASSTPVPAMMCSAASRGGMKDHNREIPAAPSPIIFKVDWRIFAHTGSAILGRFDGYTVPSLTGCRSLAWKANRAGSSGAAECLVYRFQERGRSKRLLQACNTAYFGDRPHRRFAIIPSHEDYGNRNARA